jgi:UDP-glucose 4-epimerase
MVVPRFVEAALRGEPITIYGTGNQTRCFGHVLDVIDAMIRVEALETTIGRPINIGVNQEISIMELAKRVLEITNSKSKIAFQEYEEAYTKGFEDMERRVPNNSLLKELTDWSPRRDINQIITDCMNYSISKTS